MKEIGSTQASRPCLALCANTPAETAIAETPQNATCQVAFHTGAPPIRAATVPDAARKMSDAIDSHASSGCGGTAQHAVRQRAAA